MSEKFKDILQILIALIMLATLLVAIMEFNEKIEKKANECTEKVNQAFKKYFNGTPGGMFEIFPSSTKEETDKAEEGRNVFLNILKLDSCNVLAYRGLGHIYTILGNMDKAELNYLNAIKKAPEDIDAKISLSALYLGTDRYEKAEKEMTKVLELDPQNHKALTIRGTAYDQQGKLERAKEDYENAIKYGPPDSILEFNLGTILWRLVEKPRVESYRNDAKLHLQKAIDIDYTNVSAMVNLADALREERECEKSDRWFKKAIDLKPKHWKAMKAWAEVKDCLGEKERANDLRKKAKSLEVLDNKVSQ